MGYWVPGCVGGLSTALASLLVGAACATNQRAGTSTHLPLAMPPAQPVTIALMISQMRVDENGFSAEGLRQLLTTGPML